ncbi:metallophosphoesterase family protein [Devosia riboflavina]
MKIAIITDIHHGPKSHTKETGWDGMATMEAFVEHANAIGADLLLDLGDHISDTDHATDVRAANEVANTLSQFKGPRYHVVGNHDVTNLSIGDNEDIFGQSMQSQVFDLGAARLILWQPGVNIGLPGGFAPTTDALPWLVETLKADSKPAIIATHVPLSGHSQIGNFYFENNYQYSTYPDHAAVRRAVEATGNAAMWLAGHVHWNTVTPVAGIQHVTIQSMSERFTTAPASANAFAVLEINDDLADLTVHGNDPFHAKLAFRRSGDRPWLTPMGPFGSEAEVAAELENA